MKYFLIFIVVFFFPSAFARICEESFSVDEIDRREFLRRADEELKQALNEIRETPQEPVLKAQGYKPTYYKGLDQAREFNEVAKYLRAIQADPEKTHIPYFADQVEKTLADFENSFRKHNQDKPEFLEERLKILEEIKKEAQRRMKDQNVTYDWWVIFNFRLPIIISSEFPTTIHRINQTIIEDKFEDPAERVKAGIEIIYNKKLTQKIKEKIRYLLRENRRLPKIFRSQGELLHLQKMKTKLKQLNPRKILFKGKYTSEELEEIGDDIFDGLLAWRGEIMVEIIEANGLYNDTFKNHKRMQELLLFFKENNRIYLRESAVREVRPFILTKEKFPEEIMFFTTDELGIMAFNKLEDHSHFVGVSGSPVAADGFKRDPFDFFIHDVVHLDLAQSKLRKKIPKKVLERIDNISKKAVREKAELALFMYCHERANGLFSLDIENYINIDTNLFSPSELSQIVVDDKRYARERINSKGFDNGPARRFLDPDNLQGMIPDGVDANNREEVGSFLSQAEDVFVDILLAPL